MNILTICQKSQGLEHDAGLLHKLLKDFNERVVASHISVPYRAIDWRNNSFEAELGFAPDLVIHLQDIFKIDVPSKTRQVFIPNLEWLNAYSEENAGRMDGVWHKTRSALEEFGMGVYTGFSSFDLGLRVKGFDSAGHFKGKSSYRSSRQIVSVWERREDFKKLRLHMYGNSADIGFFEHQGWFVNKNMEIRIGHMPPDKYWEEVTQSGIHLCTSVYEGFGHYINECRAMGGVAVIIDGAPMNEMVDESCGYLVKPQETQKIKGATAHLASEEAIEECLERVFSAPLSELEEKGRVARKRYEEDYDGFKHNLFQQMLALGFERGQAI